MFSFLFAQQQQQEKQKQVKVLMELSFAVCFNFNIVFLEFLTFPLFFEINSLKDKHIVIFYPPSFTI